MLKIRVENSMPFWYLIIDIGNVLSFCGFRIFPLFFCSTFCPIMSNVDNFTFTVPANSELLKVSYISFCIVNISIINSNNYSLPSLCSFQISISFSLSALERCYVTYFSVSDNMFSIFLKRNLLLLEMLLLYRCPFYCFQDFFIFVFGNLTMIWLCLWWISLELFCLGFAHFLNL